jgi:hypothetical protein
MWVLHGSNTHRISHCTLTSVEQTNSSVASCRVSIDDWNISDHIHPPPHPLEQFMLNVNLLKGEFHLDFSAFLNSIVSVFVLGVRGSIWSDWSTGRKSEDACVMDHVFSQVLCVDPLSHHYLLEHMLMQVLQGNIWTLDYVLIVATCKREYYDNVFATSFPNKTLVFGLLCQ